MGTSPPKSWQHSTWTPKHQPPSAQPRGKRKKEEAWHHVNKRFKDAHTTGTSGSKMLARKYREGSKGFAHRTLKALQSFHSDPGSWLQMDITEFLSRGVFDSALRLTPQFLSSARKKRQNGPTAICPQPPFFLECCAHFIFNLV